MGADNKAPAIAALAFAVGYSLIAVMEFTAWTQIGRPNSMRNGVNISILLIFSLVMCGGLIVISARRLRQVFSMPRVETALTLIIAVFAVLTTYVSTIDAKAAEVGLINILVICVTGILLTNALRSAPVWYTRAVVLSIPLQTLLYLPAVTWLYATSLFDAGVWWWSGPPGWGSYFRYWSVLLAAGVLVLGGLLSAPRSKGVYASVCLAMVALFICLLWTGSRANLVGLCVACLAGAVLVPGFARRSLPALVLTAFLAVPFALQLEIPSKGYGVFFADNNTDGLDGVDLSSGRLTLWKNTAAMIADRPLLGHGFNQMVHYTDNKYSEPHNAVLQFIFDFGFVGGTALIVLLLIIWWKSTKRYLGHKDVWHGCVLVVVFHLATTSMFEFILHAEETILLLCICFAVLLSRPAPGLEEPDIKR